MAWERRGNQDYYYKSVRNGKKVQKIYFGRGPLAETAAAAMDVARRERERRRQAARADREQYEEAEAALVALDAALDRVLDAEEIDIGSELNGDKYDA